jgi:hypothetical protein
MRSNAMSEHKPSRSDDHAGSPSRRPGIGLWIVRYGIGIVMVIAGIVMLIASPAGLGVDGFAMAVGGGLAVLMLNFLYRLGVSGDAERTRHEEAWRYFEEHGEWPEDRPRDARKWTLPPGVRTAEDEAAAQASDPDATTSGSGSATRSAR